MSYEDAGSGELPDVNDRERPAELPCYEVDGFGHYRHDPRRPHHVIRDWPTIWAVAVIDDVSRKYYLHDGYAVRERARDEAQRIAVQLLSPEGMSMLPPFDDGLRRNLYVRFEIEVSRSSVLFGPLSGAGIHTFALATDEDVLLEEVLKLQQETAMDFLRLTTRGLKMLPKDVRQRVWSFAFTPRASPHPACDTALSQHLPPMVFSIDGTYHKQIPPYFGTWIATVPHDATVNDVVRLMHAKLWDLAEDEDHAHIYYDDHILLGACLKLLWPEPDRSIPRYIRQAKSFQQFVDGLALKDGLPHVKALAYDRWTGSLEEFY